MFKTHAGPVEDEGSVAYLRPETAQGMFTNFLNVAHDHAQEAALRHRPGGQVVPQRDHAAATSSSAPASSSRWRWSTSSRRPRRGQWFEYWVDRALQLVPRPRDPEPSMLRLRPHEPDELSHYSAGTTDVEFLFPWGWGELEGIANRTDFDLKAHAAASGEKLEYFDQAANERYTPYVIEPAAGATRAMMAFLLAAYARGRGRRRGPHACCASTGGSPRTRWPCCPLSKKDELEPTAREVLAAPAAALPVRLRRDPVDRPALPAPGRGRHAVVRDGRLRLPRGPRRHRARPRHAPSRSGCPSTACWPSSSAHGARALSRSPLRRACGTCAPRGAPGRPEPDAPGERLARRRTVRVGRRRPSATGRR